MTADIDLITEHVGPATVRHWQDSELSGDERAVQNFKTVLEYGQGLSFGTITDYTKDAYAVRVNGEDAEAQPNWSAVSRYVDRMKHGDVDRTCDRCDRPAFDTYDAVLCRSHFLETMGSAWAEKLPDNGLKSKNTED